MKLLICAIILLSLSVSAHANKTIVMVVPDDFMWPEYQIPKELYEKAGFKVVVAGKWKESLKPDIRNKSEYPDAKPIVPEITFDEIAIDKISAISFAGGNGAWHDFFPNSKVHEILRKAITENKVVGLLCTSTGLLGVAGNFSGAEEPVAKGRRVVGYYKVEGLLKVMGQVQFIEGKRDEVTVTRDKNLVTGRNPQSSRKFAEEVLKAISEVQ